jgi:hemoglobin
MKKAAAISFAFALLMSAITTFAQESKSPTAQKSLYQRLGGYDAIAAVTQDFLGRLGNDPQLKRFFIGLSTDSKRKVRNHTVDFLCMATGGPCEYTGRDMETVHTGLNITDADWDISVKHLIATLEKFKVPAQEKQEVLTAISSLKPKVVNR